MPPRTLYRAICPICSWEQTTLTREQAEHMKRVHEHWVDHRGVSIEVLD